MPGKKRFVNLLAAGKALGSASGRSRSRVIENLVSAGIVNVQQLPDGRQAIDVDSVRRFQNNFLSVGEACKRLGVTKEALLFVAKKVPGVSVKAKKWHYYRRRTIELLQSRSFESVQELFGITRQQLGALTSLKVLLVSGNKVDKRNLLTCLAHPKMTRLIADWRIAGRLLTSEETMQLTGLNKHELSFAFKQGRIKAMRFSNLALYRRTSVDLFLAAPPVPRWSYGTSAAAVCWPRLEARLGRKLPQPEVQEAKALFNKALQSLPQGEQQIFLHAVARLKTDEIQPCLVGFLAQDTFGKADAIRKIRNGARTLKSIFGTQR